MVERITRDGELYAIVIRQDYTTKGVEFFTPTDFPQQLGINVKNEDDIVEPHQHNEVERTIHRTQEVLFFREGKAEVTLYTDDKESFDSVIVEAGDVIMFTRGGHGLKMLEDTELVEVKQGPFLGSDDKELFDTEPGVDET